MAIRFYLLGGVLALIGAVGLIMPTPLFGILDTSPLLNAIHIIMGLITIVAATRGLGTMRAWGQAIGYVFAALATAGFVTDAETVNNLLPLTTSDSWFHLVVSLIFLYHALLAPPTL